MRIRRKQISRVNWCFNGPEGQGGGGGTAAPSIEQSLSNAFADKASSDVSLPEPEAIAGTGQGASVQQATESTGTGNGTEQQQTVSSTDWLYNELSERLSNGDNKFELPEELKTGKTKEGKELSTKEKFDSLLKIIYDNTNFDADDDEFTSAYKAEKASKGDKFSMDEFIQKHNDRINIMKADNPTFMTKWLQSQTKEDGSRKHSDQDITDYINKLNPIELEEKVSQLKSSIQKANSELANKNMGANKEEAERKFNEWDTRRKEEVNKVINSAKSWKDIGGIQLAEGDIETFSPVFEKMTSYNPQTGNLYMEDYLQSNNDNVFKALYLMHLADTGGMMKYMSDLKEDVKSKILSKTGIRPNLSSGGLNESFEKAPTASQFK